ncbi:MAG TPA: hypothetical protein VG826_33200 [Pirellulales bacterium]|nr:hypothetical protein [Pirellulales bacterium]
MTPKLNQTSLVIAIRDDVEPGKMCLLALSSMPANTLTGAG